MAGKERKLILFTVTNDLNYDQRMNRICSTLFEVGYNVKLIGRKKPSSSTLDDFVFSSHRLNCWFNRGFWFYFEYNLRLLFYFIKNKPKAICAIDLDTAYAARFYAYFSKVILIFDSHELFTELPEIIHRPRIQKFWKWIGRATVPNFDHCYTVNQSLSKILSKKYQKDFKVVRNVPVLNNKASVNPEIRDQFIFYQGVLNKGRGLEALIQCMPDFPELKLKLAGEGDLSKQLREMVRDLGLESQVEFLGFVLPSDLKEVTESSWLGVNLLEDVSQNYYYSLANKFFDYMHAGVPMICMDFPEYRSINDENEVAYLIPNLDKEELKKAIKKFVRDSSFHQQLKDNCITAREKYKWQEEKKSLIAIYDAILDLKLS